MKRTRHLARRAAPWLALFGPLLGCLGSELGTAGGLSFTTQDAVLCFPCAPLDRFATGTTARLEISPASVCPTRSGILPTVTSSNTAVLSVTRATASDSGCSIIVELEARAPGDATLTATIDGVTDSLVRHVSVATMMTVAGGIEGVQRAGTSELRVRVGDASRTPVAVVRDAEGRALVVPTGEITWSFVPTGIVEAHPNGLTGGVSLLGLAVGSATATVRWRDVSTNVVVRVDR